MPRSPILAPADVIGAGAEQEDAMGCPDSL
jgi:hypothetical protein